MPQGPLCLIPSTASTPALKTPATDSTHQHEKWPSADPAEYHPRKAAGPHNIPERVLRGCSHQLSKELRDIFNASLSQAVVPNGRKGPPYSLNAPKQQPKWLSASGPHPDSQELLWKIQIKIKDCVDVTVDPHWYIYHRDRPTYDTISSMVYTIH